jgi:NAD(P)-dependent dehydrogenase (short-subunit alcohol dehydrogenase family)
MDVSFRGGGRTRQTANLKEVVMLVEGKLAVVTGAASGIGREVALTMAHEGARVIVVDQNREEGERVLQELADEGAATPLFHKVDVRSADDIQSMFDEVQRQAGGGVDILVNCAGIREIAMPLELSYDEWNRVLAVNLSGTFYCCQAAARQMARRDGGAIVNISSLAGIRAVENRPAYTASKFGVIGLTMSLARDLGPLKIRVNAVAPGLMRTPLTEMYFTDEEFVKSIPQVIPLGEYGRPQYVAQAVLFLASNMAEHVTGVTLPVDGGHTIMSNYSVGAAAESPFSAPFSPAGA